MTLLCMYDEDSDGDWWSGQRFSTWILAGSITSDHMSFWVRCEVSDPETPGLGICKWISSPDHLECNPQQNLL